jgi:hypothetical protein
MNFVDPEKREHHFKFEISEQGEGFPSAKAKEFSLGRASRARISPWREEQARVSP